MARHLLQQSTWLKELKPNQLWYFVGVIASDGSLSKDGRHVDITSKDYEFLKLLKETLKLPGRVTPKSNGHGGVGYRIQISDRAFYNFLTGLGLMPKKSLRLGPISVSNEHLRDFLRGVIDGDGNIRRWIHPKNGREQWALRIYSGSEDFVKWLQDRIEALWSVKGAMHKETKGGTRPWYILKYGKIAARVILTQCYSDGALSLERKVRLAKECMSSKIGWTQSKTAPGWRNRYTRQT